MNPVRTKNIRIGHSKVAAKVGNRSKIAPKVDSQFVAEAFGADAYPQFKLGDTPPGIANMPPMSSTSLGALQQVFANGPSNTGRKLS